MFVCALSLRHYSWYNIDAKAQQGVLSLIQCISHIADMTITVVLGLEIWQVCLPCLPRPHHSHLSHMPPLAPGV